MPERPLPAREELYAYLQTHKNWGRWGSDDQVGAMNLITPQKRVAAAALVRSGRALSLSMDYPKTPGPSNPNPAQHWMRVQYQRRSGGASDYFAYTVHGFAATHLDALCHVWGRDGMWNGRDPSRELTFDGALWGGIDKWGSGIVTRGVLLDVPRHRREPFVAQDRPVAAWELEDIAEEEGIAVEPGDALLVYGGRPAWEAANGSYTAPGPGLHASCAMFVRDNDVALLGWDLMDAAPNEYGLAYPVHDVIFEFGVGLLDNAYLEPLARACAEEGRYEFMLTVAPLRVVGGTGSLVNPIALF